MELPGVFTKSSCEISMAFDFWLWNFHQRGDTQFCRVCRGKNLFSQGKETNLKISGFFSEKYLANIFNHIWSFSRIAQYSWKKAGNVLHVMSLIRLPRSETARLTYIDLAQMYFTLLSVRKVWKLGYVAYFGEL